MEFFSKYISNLTCMVARPGWVDNYNGPSGVFAGIGKGVLRTIYCMRDSVADMVPVDVCINLLCAIAWETARVGPGKPIKVQYISQRIFLPLTILPRCTTAPAGA